jgi:CheY-like chemotaxis protein
MPLMDGIETTRRLRAAPGLNAGTPVIALTANVMEDQCAAYQAAGMNAFVAKPINPRQLLSVIAEFANPDGQTASALEHEASSA